MKRVVVAAVPLAFVIAASCSESKDRAPGVPTCMGLTCPTGPGPGTSGSNGDAGPDAPEVSDAPFEVGEAGVTVQAIVRPLTSFTADLDTATTFDTAMVAVRAPRIGGGADVEASMADIEGKFTLAGVQPSFGAPTYFQVVKNGLLRTHAAVDYREGAVFNLPRYSDELIVNTWTTSGAMTTYPTGASAVVVHVTRAGTRASNVKAAPVGTARGPYYDEGTDVGFTAIQTGARGTIVFLGITGVGAFPVQLTTATSTRTVNLTLASGAVTHATIAVD